MCCLSWVPLAGIGHWDVKQPEEGRAGTEAEALEEHGLLACSSWLTQPAFPYAQKHLARKLHPSEVAPPTLVISEENT